MPGIKEKLVVALDVDNLKEAERFVNLLFPAVKMFKVGSQLFTAAGLEAIQMIGKKGASVFLDLKFHDIPNTVYKAVASGTASAINLKSIPIELSYNSLEQKVKNSIVHPVFMLTVHTQGGLEMMKAAARAAEEKSKELKIRKPFIVGVTVLTSDSATANTKETVLERALLAKEAGLDGVVCAVSEASLIREKLGTEFLIVTPGIRPNSAELNDQKRAATCEEAIKAGSNFLVIGRPILEARDPLLVVKEILTSIS